MSTEIKSKIITEYVPTIKGMTQNFSEGIEEIESKLLNIDTQLHDLSKIVWDLEKLREGIHCIKYYIVERNNSYMNYYLELETYREGDEYLEELIKSFNNSKYNYYKKAYYRLLDERKRLYHFLNIPVLNQKIELGYLKSIETLKVFAYETDYKIREEDVLEEEDIF